MIRRVSDALLNSVRGRLILLVAAVVLAAVVFAALLLVSSQHDERAAVERQLGETTRALSLVVDRQLGQSEALLRTLATSPALDQGDYEAFHRQARAAVQGDDRWVRLVTPGGTQLVNTYLPFRTPLPDAPLPSDLAAALAEGRTYVSNLTASRAASTPVLTVAVPVVRDGEVAFSLTMVMRPSVLSDVLSDQDVAPEWVAAIVDRDGTVVARSRLPERYVGGKATDDLRAALATTGQGVIESVTLDGVPTLAAYSRSPGFGLTVVVGAPQSELYAPARRRLLLALALSLALVVVGVGASGWVARGVARSVEALSAAAGALGRGDASPLSPTGLRETDQVAEALHDSAVRLKAREDDLHRLNETLEERVAERTEQVRALASTLTMAEQEERRRISQILHDDLQQRLYGVQMKAVLIQRAAETAPVEWAQRDRLLESAADVEAWLQEAIQVTRWLTVDLSPPVLKGEGLRDALGWLVTQMREVHGLDVELKAPASFRMQDEDMRVLLFQIIRELLFNVVKHAGVGRASVELSGGTDRCIVVVSDEGRGFDVGEAAGHESHDRGFGLFSVRERLDLFGGQMEVASAPGAGTRVTIRTPVQIDQDDVPPA